MPKFLYSKEAKDDIQRFHVDLRRRIAEKIKVLEDDPGVAKPSVCPPHRPGYLVYEFDTDYRNAWHRFSIFFKPGKTGEELHLHMIGHVEYAHPKED